MKAYRVNPKVDTTKNMQEAYRWIAELENRKPTEEVDLEAFLASIKNLIALLLQERMTERNIERPKLS